ncbi:MAG: hypothetical protein CVU65_14105 [Deltaproteobacteria bacterium HGW-Deltaproteobacteria-22]|nr:MAG: hypothetical protein CVU65_14105 [Deltaproteobacteria bacterium HGW-Deltaproteobacteria-22]
MLFKIARTMFLGCLLLTMGSCAKGRAKPPCGDGVCEAGESWESCLEDCTPPCGDGISQGDEECDGTDLRGATCLSIGLGAGTLSCATISCYLDTSACGPCTDECASADPATCDGDTLVTCAQNNYTCWKWLRTDCTETTQVCDEGTGVARCSDTCTDACTADGTRCVESVKQTCVTGDNGCLGWSATEDCETSGRLCEAGDCVCPAGSCTPETSTCDGSVIQSCVAQANGCGVIEAGADCAATGWLCDPGTGTCVPDCVSACTPEDSTGCDDTITRTCTMQPSGCLDWVAGEDCAPSGRTCTGGVCTCNHDCTELQGQCSGTVTQSCVADAYGCRHWVSGEDCAPSGRTCTSGTCLCNHQCTIGQLQCTGTTTQSCTTDAYGCRYWTSNEDCAATGRLCSAGACVCNSNCSEGQLQCVGNFTQTCTGNAFGCWAWVNDTDCAATGRLCSAGACVCNNQCTAGTLQCAGNTIQTCTTNAYGCTSWVSGTDCAATGQLCSGGTCVCNNQCTAGTFQCAGDTVQTCTVNAGGCYEWVSGTNCADTGRVCSGGACACSDTCSSGQAQCAGSLAQSCLQDAYGCWDWLEDTCAAPTEFCGTGACHGYTRTNFTGTYSQISGGTSLTTDSDDATFSITLPFTFYYWGQAYTTAYACSNGWLHFGTNPGTSEYSNGSSFPDSGDPANTLYPFWDDLDIDYWDCWSSAGLRWETQGTAPNRVVIVQWRDFCAYLCTTCRGNMQIRLYETSNVIEFLYNRSSWSGSYSASIGIEEDSRGLGLTVTGSISGVPGTDYRFTPY